MICGIVCVNIKTKRHTEELVHLYKVTQKKKFFCWFCEKVFGRGKKSKSFSRMRCIVKEKRKCKTGYTKECLFICLSVRSSFSISEVKKTAPYVISCARSQKLRDKVTI